jgi:DNA repair photolyase
MLKRPIFITDHIDRLLCPLPLKISPYRGCEGKCAYCSMDGLRGHISGVAPSSIKPIERLFSGHIRSMEGHLIDQRSPVQIGPNSDPLQPCENAHRVTLKILRILQDREYPTVITTKFPHILTDPEYLRAIEGLPLAVQCSISTEDQAMLSRLEPEPPSWRRRLAAMSTLHDAGVHVILRLWPFIPDLCGNIEYLLACAKDAGIEKVQCNPLKLYSAGRGKRRINEALGYDYEANSPIRYVRSGVFKAPSLDQQVKAISMLEDSCRELGLDLLTCDDLTGHRAWRDCFGVGGLPEFKPSPWAYYVNGYRIDEHTDFETYMRGHDCPWHDEFEQEWNKGKLAKSISELIFNNDNTYTRRW